MIVFIAKNLYWKNVTKILSGANFFKFAAFDENPCDFFYLK